MEYTVKHVMSDGRHLDSIDGYVIPCTGPTAAVYRVIAEMSKKKEKAEKNTAAI